MKPNLRDYFSLISFFGLFTCANGLYRLSGTVKWELLGGGQLIIGFFLIMWGLVFLRFLDDEPGLIDSLAERLLQRFQSLSA